MHERIPGRRDVESDRRNRPHARDHDAPLPFALGEGHSRQYSAAPRLILLAPLTAKRLHDRSTLLSRYHSPTLTWHSGTESANRATAHTVTELTPRRERILRHVVQEYVALAQPVPSDLIARKYEAELSPATVRSELVALEEAGLIDHPHTSAGRVPTDRGYRYFVELLMQEERDLAPAERRTLRQQFNHLAAAGTDSTVLGATLLARALRSAAVATRPAATHARVRRIELVPSKTTRFWSPC